MTKLPRNLLEEIKANLRIGHCFGRKILGIMTDPPETEGTDAYLWHMAGKLDRLEKSHLDLEKFIKGVFPNYPDTTCYVQPKAPATSSNGIQPEQHSVPCFPGGILQISQKILSFPSNEAGITHQHKRGMPTSLIDEQNYSAPQKDSCAQSSSASLGTPPAKKTRVIQNLEGPASSSSPSKLPSIDDFYYFNKSYKSHATTEEFDPNYQNVANVAEEQPAVVIVANEPEMVGDELIGTWKFCATCEVFDEIGAHHECNCKCNSNEICEVFGHPKQ